MSEMIFQRKNSCNNCYSNRLVDRLQMTENIWKYLVFVTFGQIKQAARIHHLGLSGIIVMNPEKNCHTVLLIMKMKVTALETKLVSDVKGLPSKPC